MACWCELFQQCVIIVGAHFTSWNEAPFAYSMKALEYNNLVIGTIYRDIVK